MDYDLRDFVQRQPPHWCCDDHPPIGHFDSEEELCPVCRAKNEQVAAEERYDRERAIVDRVWKALGITTYAEAKGKTIDALVAEQKRRIDDVLDLIDGMEDVQDAPDCGDEQIVQPNLAMRVGMILRGEDRP